MSHYDDIYPYRLPDRMDSLSPIKPPYYYCTKNLLATGFYLLREKSIPTWKKRIKAEEKN